MDGRASISVSAADIVKDLKLDLSDKDKKEALIIERDTKDILELEHLPLLHFKEAEKEEILSELTKLTESNISGWTHEAQKFYLDKAIRDIKFENPIVKNAFENKEIRFNILEMMLYGKYILQYRKVARNHEKALYYISQFKEKLDILINQYKELKPLIHALREVGGIFRMLPLAYHEIALHDEMLTEFRISELVGHNVAYKIAKNENKFKKIIVVSKTGKVLEEYSVHEIKVTRDNKRDQALKGVILIPLNKKEEQISTIYITWAGTYSRASIYSDVEIAPGEETYRQGEDQILKQIVAAIEELGKPVKIVICGHSLGGAFSQLSLHSLQRIIALNIKDVEIRNKAIQLEDNFHKMLEKQSPHQRDLSDIKINPEKIREMSIGVWNSERVLMPVAEHMGELGTMLTGAGIQHFAYFGSVNGDILEGVGQGSILDQIYENGFKIKVLKIEYGSTKTLVTALGITAAIPVGLTFLGTNPAGWATSIFCVGAVLGKVISDTKIAHTKHHFKNGIRPEDAYSVYTSHQSDGSLNVGECKIIHEALSSKSTSLIETGLQMISDTLMQEERFNSKLKKAILADSKSAEKLEKQENLFMFLISNIKSNIADDELRIIKLIKDKKLLLPVNNQDSLGKTLLHYAIENGKFDLAHALLDVPGINVNLIDAEKNFPLLLFMQQINTFLPHMQNTYLLGTKFLAMTTVDLSLKNNKDLSVEKIYNSWYWAGYNAKSFTLELSKRLKPIKIEEQPKPLHKMEKSIMR